MGCCNGPASDPCAKGVKSFLLGGGLIASPIGRRGGQQSLMSHNVSVTFLLRVKNKRTIPRRGTLKEEESIFENIYLLLFLVICKFVCTHECRSPQNF